MAVVGAFARIDPAGAKEICASIEALPQVSTFDLHDSGKVGLLIDASDLGQAHDALTKQIRAIEGVWGVWPVYVHSESDEEKEQQAASEPA